ncbi:unnamed protein product, partial [Brenthis ino]
MKHAPHRFVSVTVESRTQRSPDGVPLTARDETHTSPRRRHGVVLLGTRHCVGAVGADGAIDSSAAIGVHLALTRAFIAQPRAAGRVALVFST